LAATSQEQSWESLAQRFSPSGLAEEPFVVVVIAYPKPRNRISIEHA